MQSYNYRSVKAIADHRYQKLANHPVSDRSPGSDRIWQDEIWKDRVPIRRKRRIAGRAPDRSRAA